MRRRSEPRGALIGGCMVAAVLLLHAALAGGATLVKRFGGFGLADQWDGAKADNEVQLELMQEPFQVVEIERPKVEQVPDRTRFRSEFNAKVKKQTAAKLRGLKDRAVAMIDRKPPVSADQLSPQPEPQPRPAPVEPDPNKPSPLGMRRPAPSKPDKDRGTQKNPIWKKKLTLRDLKPKNGVLQKVIPGAFPDYLKDIDKGDKTLLNTKEWRFASFFNRVKRAVAQHWHPGKEYTRRDPKGNIYGFKTRITHLHIVLHPNGTLKKIVLQRPCGLTFLDDEAIRAFRKAAPFPNPPKRLVNPKTKQIAFRFGFIFEITSSPRWRVIRLK